MTMNLTTPNPSNPTLSTDANGALYTHDIAPEFSVLATLAVTNGAYTIGDAVGGLITFANVVSANGKSGQIRTIALCGVVAIAYDLMFFQSDIAAPAADNAALNLAAADGQIFVGAVPIVANDYVAAANAFNNATIRGVALDFKCGAATRSLYAYLKATAVTSPATATLYLRITGQYLD